MSDFIKGSGFRLTTGPSSFARKLSGKTKYGGWKNLDDKRPKIIEAFTKYERAIKGRGGLTESEARRLRWDIYGKIRNAKMNLTEDTKRDIEHLVRDFRKTSSGSTQKKSSGSSFWGTKKNEKPAVKPWLRAESDAQKAVGEMFGSTRSMGFAGSNKKNASGNMMYANQEPNRYAKSGGGGFALGKKSGASANQGKALGRNDLRPIV